jgi:methylmalonyl-CoA mutase C-terminal domain/subunit
MESVKRGNPQHKKMRSGMVMKGKIKVLIAKPGLDGHEAGAKLIARVLVDAGMEVIYTGPRQTPEKIVNAAIQEDVDLIGISILSGSHIEFSQRILALLQEKDMKNMHLVVGGIIPPSDIHLLKEMGVKGVFVPGTDTREVVRFIEQICANDL